jgi:hypothetical protein
MTIGLNRDHITTMPGLNQIAARDFDKWSWVLRNHSVFDES